MCKVIWCYCEFSFILFVSIILLLRGSCALGKLFSLIKDLDETTLVVLFRKLS